MFTLYMNIRIGDFRFSRANGVEIRKSINNIGSTAKIKVPASAVIENKGVQSGLVEVQKKINVGDPVRITVGYHTKSRDYESEEFSGYVRSINPTIPLEIECEDNNYLLRQHNFNKSWKNTTLKEVLSTIVQPTDIELVDNIPEIQLSPFYLKNIDGAFALQKLADEYGLTIYFHNDGKLYAGLAYADNLGEETLIINGDEANVIDADSLKFRRAEDVKLKIKAVSIRGDNTKIETEIGDENGALRTLNFYNIHSLDKLTDLAKQEMTKYKFDGFEGSVKCFLIPFVYPAYKVNITDEIFPDRSGSYFVESTVLTVGDSGVRRDIEISIKL